MLVAPNFASKGAHARFASAEARSPLCVGGGPAWGPGPGPWAGPGGGGASTAVGQNAMWGGVHGCRTEYHAEISPRWRSQTPNILCQPPNILDFPNIAEPNTQPPVSRPQNPGPPEFVEPNLLPTSCSPQKHSGCPDICVWAAKCGVCGGGIPVADRALAIVNLR